MERIRLTKREKAVLRILSRQGCEALSEFDASDVREFSERGFVKVIEDAKLTAKGKEYLRDYPSLCNPIPWSKVAAIVSLAGALAAILSLFVSCLCYVRFT